MSLDMESLSYRLHSSQNLDIGIGLTSNVLTILHEIVHPCK